LKAGTADGLDESELRALAAERPNRTVEIHPFNAFYGHDRILKRYAGRPERRPLAAAVEHGLVVDDTVSSIERRLALPVHLTQSQYRADVVARAIPGVEAVPIGPMIRYVEALHPPPQLPGRDGVVLFPAHSVHTMDADYDVDELLRRTADYRSAFRDTTVCLYWRDVLLGRDAAYRAAGLACTTAGHMYDPLFLFRLLDILRRAAAVVTNEVGTHVAYAVLVGCPVWIVDQPVAYRESADTPDDQVAALDAFLAAPTTGDLEKLFAAPTDAPTPDQRAAIASATGEPHMRTREELARILAGADARYLGERPLARRMVDTARSRARRFGLAGRTRR
jgi:hypothetical protein